MNFNNKLPSNVSGNEEQKGEHCGIIKTELAQVQDDEDQRQMSSRSIIIEESDQDSDGNELRKLPSIHRKEEYRKNKLRFAPDTKVKKISQKFNFTATKRLGYKSIIRKSISADIDKIYKDHDSKKILYYQMKLLLF